MLSQLFKLKLQFIIGGVAYRFKLSPLIKSFLTNQKMRPVFHDLSLTPNLLVLSFTNSLEKYAGNYALLSFIQIYKIITLKTSISLLILDNILFQFRINLLDFVFHSGVILISFHFQVLFGKLQGGHRQQIG